MGFPDSCSPGLAARLPACLLCSTGTPSQCGRCPCLLSEEGCSQWPVFAENPFIQRPFCLSLPWLWYFVFRDCCPNRIWSFLFFKSSFEYFLNVIHAKCTDGRTRNAAKGETIRKPSGDNGPVRGSHKHRQNVVWGAQDRFLPVELCGEHPDHGGDAIDLDYVRDRLQDIKVEKRISRDGAVKPSLQEWRPVFLQDPLGATHVVFTYAGHTGIDSLPVGQSRVRGDEHGGGRKAKSCCLWEGQNMLQLYLAPKNLAVLSVGICRLSM